MAKGKEPTEKMPTDRKKQPPAPKLPTAATAKPTIPGKLQSPTPRVGPTEGESSSKAQTGRHEEIEKAYNKLFRGGATLLSIAYTDFENLQKEVAKLRKEKQIDVTAITNELAAIRASGPSDSSAVQELQEMYRQQQQSQETDWKKLKEWQTILEQKVEALLKLKTPCALTKVELTNTIRKEVGSLRQHQTHLVEIQPKPLVRDDIQGIIDDQRELRTTYKRIEDKVDQTAKDLSHLMDKFDRNTKDHTHLMDRIDRNARDLVNLTVTLDTLHSELRSFFSQTTTRTPQPRRSTDDRHSRTSADDTRSTSIRGSTEPAVRSTVTRVQRPEKDGSRSLQEVRDDIRTADDDLRRLKRRIEETLRENKDDSTTRLQELREDKQRVIARKERLESEERRLARKSNAQQDDRVDQTPSHKRTRHASRDRD
ncbi:hypothetical protein TELCIR_13541 [Teladorsagia circumcincta]|uniref:Uncharacterized protein n=1 Tax=Teladorsagia circumcincta TaxID=45464 RepID=A0A2G9U3Q0_TELCI|nr:hypothetical protein TELCIR_13541 [Teladorsagia circumcincta]